MSERTQKLKKDIHYKSSIARLFRATGDFKCETLPKAELRPEIRICIERLRLITESYKATEGESMPIRRAKALSHVLDNMTVYISDGELIVGNFASNPESLPFFPEVSHRWMDRAITNGYSDRLSDEDKIEYMELIQYWKGKSVADRIISEVPKDLKPYMFFNGACDTSHFGGWRPGEIDNYAMVLEEGLAGVLKRVRERLAGLDLDQTPIEEYLQQKHNLKAMEISLEAGIRFGKRYAEKAEELAANETDSERKKELFKVADVCRWVPENPARTTHEAIQSVFLSFLISKSIEAQGQGFGNRMDQLINPFYQKDRESGRITREEAQELMECLLVKFAEKGHLQAPEGVGIYAGISDVKDIVIGGVTLKGADATNDFSFIILDAAEELRLPEPTIALRYHPKISGQLMSKAVDVIRTGIGYPALYNDSAIIPFLLSRGIPLKEARDYGIWACVSVSIQGKPYRTSRPNVGFISLGKCLELALYQGKDRERYTGKQIGSETPDPRDFKSFDEMMDAYFTQVEFFAERMALIDNIAQAYYNRHMHRPFASTLLDGCIEEGKDCNAWSYNGLTNVQMTGATNAIDGLAAIKKFVFEDKTISMAELIEACRTNFEDREELRQMLLNDAPKYGNDDDYVDSIAREVHLKSNEIFMKKKDYYGKPFSFDGTIAGGYHFVSTGCGALPDGKKDSEPFADAVVSPAAGRDKKGPTAVLNSLSKIDYTYAHLFNQRFMPQFLQGDNKKLFLSYLKTWCDLGIGHIQFNVVDKQTLLNAKKRPEDYQDLVVRVAGYSAYYVDLSKEIQDDIMQRMAQGF
ncbi:MAG: hypothetical protein JRJ45_02750 [Deltaproteobacteria bacterium]|nr:hypothetical protein [Deltaproteobacteria bacterium]